jgi:hypothetical protein
MPAALLLDAVQLNSNNTGSALFGGRPKAHKAAAAGTAAAQWQSMAFPAAQKGSKEATLFTPTLEASQSGFVLLGS